MEIYSIVLFHMAYAYNASFCPWERLIYFEAVPEKVKFNTKEIQALNHTPKV